MEQRKVITGFWTEPDYDASEEEVAAFKPEWVESTDLIPRLDLSELMTAMKNRLRFNTFCDGNWANQDRQEEVDVVANGETLYTALATCVTGTGEITIKLKPIEQTPERKPTLAMPTF